MEKTLFIILSIVVAVIVPTQQNRLKLKKICVKIKI